MTRHRYHRLLALLLSGSLVAAACGDSDEDTATPGGSPTTEAADGATETTEGEDGEAAAPDAEGDSTGITDSEIVLGTSTPLSGPASIYSVISGTQQACAEWINDNGGVTMADGKARNLRVVVYDDAYDPARTVENTRRLIEQDEVAAMWALLGTPTNTAIYDYTNGEEVPNLYVATGASKWGTGFTGDHPWTIGWQPAYSTEAVIYAEYLKENMPDAKVAILYQNDDFGEDYVVPFKEAIEGSNIEIVAEQTYEPTDPTVDQQIVDLASSGADVFLDITIPRMAAQSITRLASTNWEPLHMLSSVSASVGGVLEPAGLANAEGIITAQYYKDPTDPQWDDDEAMTEYRELIGQYGPDLDPNDPFVIFAWGQCQTIKHTLENAQPTREGLMEAAGSLDAVEIPVLLPGVTLNTGPDDGFPIEAMQVVQFDGTEFQEVGELLDFEGRTPAPEE